jgi:hypothetical protein
MSTNPKYSAAVEKRVRQVQSYNRMIVALDNALRAQSKPYDPLPSVRAFLDS